MINWLVEGVFIVLCDLFLLIRIKYYFGFMILMLLSVEYLVGNFLCIFCIYIKLDNLLNRWWKFKWRVVFFILYVLYVFIDDFFLKYFKEVLLFECYFNIYVMFWIIIFVMIDEILVNDYYKFGWDCVFFVM